jgi:hypothetical protein
MAKIGFLFDDMKLNFELNQDSLLIHLHARVRLDILILNCSRLVLLQCLSIFEQNS